MNGRRSVRLRLLLSSIVVLGGVMVAHPAFADHGSEIGISDLMDCSGFATQEDAQAYVNLNSQDFDHLLDEDGDGDDRPCEFLPSAASTNPAPSGPAPMESTPSNPAPSGPAPTESTPSNPEPTDSAPANSAPTATPASPLSADTTLADATATGQPATDAGAIGAGPTAAGGSQPPPASIRQLAVTGWAIGRQLAIAGGLFALGLVLVMVGELRARRERQPG